MQEIVLLTHAVVKDTAAAMTSSIKDNFLKLIGGIILYIAFLILGVMLLTPLVIFRTCLHFILKMVHGKYYGGLLNGTDIMFGINSDKTVINILIFYSCSRKKFERDALIRTFIDKVHNSTDKFRCSIKKSFGYLYFIKDQIKADDVLKIIDYNTPYITKNELHDYIEENCVTISSNQMWKVSAFNQPICNNVTGDPKNSQYAMVITVLHSVGDGPGVASAFKKVLDEDLSTPLDLCVNKQSVHTRPSLNLSSASIYRNPFTTDLTGRELKIPNHSKWHVVTYIETNPKYISIVKAIKRKLHVNFMDVIEAAIASSVNDYIIMRKVKMNTFTACKVVQVHEKKLQQIVNKTYNNLDLSNTFSVEICEVSYDGIENIKDRILYMHRISTIMYNSTDHVLFGEYLRQIGTYLPINLYRFAYNRFMAGITIVVTNLVGFNKSSYCGCSIEDILFHVSDGLQIGFTLNIFSYADRMSVTLVAGKGYVHNRDELQTILANYFKYLDKAESEVLGYRSEDTK